MRKRLVKTPQKERCENPNCRSAGKSRMQYARGLCAACYRQLLRAVEAGRVASMEDAARKGLCRPAQACTFGRFPAVAMQKSPASGQAG